MFKHKIAHTNLILLTSHVQLLQILWWSHLKLFCCSKVWSLVFFYHINDHHLKFVCCSSVWSLIVFFYEPFVILKKWPVNFPLCNNQHRCVNPCRPRTFPAPNCNPTSLCLNKYFCVGFGIPHLFFVCLVCPGVDAMSQSCRFNFTLGIFHRSPHRFGLK